MPRAIDAAALPVWYQEQLEKVRNLEASMAIIAPPDIKEAMEAVVNIHRARAAVLEQLMREELAR